MDFHNTLQNSNKKKHQLTYCITKNTKECQNNPETNPTNISYNNFLNNSSPSFSLQQLIIIIIKFHRICDWQTLKVA